MPIRRLTQIPEDSTKSKLVTLLQSQTENPYWNKSVAGTPACDAKAAVVTGSTDITFFGFVWCSWFCTLSDGISTFGPGNKNVNLFSAWSVGAAHGKPVISGQNPLSDGNFMADLAA